MLGRIESLDRHPIRKPYNTGVRVTVNSDDALLLGCRVSGKFDAFYSAGLFSPKELDQIRLNDLNGV
jgi:adenosine deaminase